MEPITLSSGYCPGALGRIVELHAAYYHRLWNVGLFFESQVAEELSAFLQGFSAERDLLLLARSGERILGSIAVHGSSAADQEQRRARLRWFIVDAACQGCGHGRALFSAALDFCRERGFAEAYLWTVTGLAGSRYLYEQAGFKVVESVDDAHYGVPLTGQRLALRLQP